MPISATVSLSMSVSGGKHNGRHNVDRNYRAKLANVDPVSTPNNVIVADERIEDAYARLFGTAVSRYNDKVRKKHPEHVIDDYYGKVLDSWKADQAKVKRGIKGRTNVPQPCYEYVLQIGNHETHGSVSRQALIEIYTNACERIKARTSGAIDWYQAVIHVDEIDGSPHMHMAGIPYATGCKRGLECQVTMSRALKALGLERLPDLQNMLMKELEAAAHAHGIERDVKGCDRPHLDVPEWKQAQRDAQSLADLATARRAEVAALDAESLRLDLSLANQISAIDACDDELGAKKAQEHALAVTIEANQELHDELVADITSMKAESDMLADKIAGQKAEAERLATENHEAERRLESLQRKEAESAEEVARYEQKADGLEEEVRRAEEEVSELAAKVALVDRLDGNRGEADEARRRISELEGERKTIQARLDEARTRLRTLASAFGRRIGRFVDAVRERIRDPFARDGGRISREAERDNYRNQYHSRNVRRAGYMRD